MIEVLGRGAALTAPGPVHTLHRKLVQALPEREPATAWRGMLAFWCERSVKWGAGWVRGGLTVRPRRG